jgi:flavin-dependent dehydrogenase
VFDPLVLPHYGWLFPESPGRVNIGICYREGGRRHNARQLFQSFLSKHYASRLRDAVQVGGWKGHPILYSYSIDGLHSPGRLVVGEAGRLTHPATGEGIYQGIRSGMMAAETLHAVLRGHQTEHQAFARYQAQCRRAFLYSFRSAKIFHRLIDSPVPDWIARMGERPALGRVVGKLMARM